MNGFEGVMSQIVEAVHASGLEDSLRDFVKQKIRDNQKDDNLGVGLPAILMNPATQGEAWRVIFGGREPFSKFFKTFVRSLDIKVSKSRIEINDQAYESLSSFCEPPAHRNTKFEKGGNGGLTFSEKMMSQLSFFEEYKAFSLDEAKAVVDKTPIGCITSLYSEKFQPIVECCDLLLINRSNMARLLRLERLDEQVMNIDDLPKLDQIRLIVGIFGIFDHANRAMLFLRYLSVYPQLQKHYEGVGVLEEVDEVGLDTVIRRKTIEYVLQCISSHAENGEQFWVFNHMVNHPLIQQYAEVENDAYLRTRVSEFRSQLDNARAHVKILAEHSNSLGDGFAVENMPHYKSMAIIDINLLDGALDDLLENEFVRKLFSKDEERARLVAMLKEVDSGDVQSLLDISERIRLLTLGFENAPDEVVELVNAFCERLARMTRHYSNPSFLAIQSESQEEVATAGPVESIAAVDEVKSLQDQLTSLQEAHALLQAQFEDQKTIIKDYKARDHHYRTIDSGRSVMVASDQEMVPKREVVEWAVEGIDTPEQVLNFLSAMFPDTVVVLDSAIKSAQGSADFKNVSKLRKDLIKLSTDYMDQLKSGVPHQQAKKAFGSSLRSGESDTVQQNARLKSMREFDYNGQTVHFMKHLAIGNRYGTANTIRVYYEVIDGKLVIAYAGEHLETTRTS